MKFASRSVIAAFFGVPIYLDHDFVELVYLYVAKEDEDEAEPYTRTAWLIRLSEVVAVGYPLETWSNDRFEELLTPDEHSNEEQRRSDST